MDMRNKKGQFLKGTHWRKQKPWWNKEWLIDQYVLCRRSSADIANEYGVGDTAIQYWLKKHGIKGRTMSEIRKHQHWGASGSDNPMWNRRGELNPRWLGGVTPERQAFYTSQEWKDACSHVWKRDAATCQRCKLYKEESNDMPFHIHHIESFANKELRADIKNLVLLCETCHQFVHSKRNINREYLPER